MVREEDVKLMSKIAIYEKHEGKTELPIHNFYKKDYVRLNTLKTIVAATVTFALILVIVAVYQLDFILANILKMDYKKLGMVLLILYAGWLLLYWLIARLVYAKRYADTRPNIAIYNYRLKKLQEEKQKEAVKTKGGVVLNDDLIDL